MALKTDGLKIRELRELKGMTQEDLARRMAFSVTHVSQVERGISNGGPRFLREAAQILGCDIADITCGTLPRRRPGQSATASDAA
jgi:transcriptional regulator with XRE-family HTH domain